MRVALDAVGAYDHVSLVYRSRLTRAHRMWHMIQGAVGEGMWLRGSWAQYGRGYGLRLCPLPRDHPSFTQCLFCFLKRVQRGASYYCAADAIAHELHCSNILA